MSVSVHIRSDGRGQVQRQPIAVRVRADVTAATSQSSCDFVLTSPAPVETAAKLSSKFRHLATREKARAQDLAAASDYCQAMAVDLMALAAAGHEDSAASLLRSVDNRGVTILDMLIECEQKDVVSHESVQEYLTQIWTGHPSSINQSFMIIIILFAKRQR